MLHLDRLLSHVLFNLLSMILFSECDISVAYLAVGEISIGLGMSIQVYI